MSGEPLPSQTGAESPAPTALSIPEADRSFRWVIAPVLALGLVLDLATKFWALQVLAPNAFTRIQVIPSCLDFRIAYNTGGAFSLFDGNVWFVTSISILCMAVVVWWARTIPKRFFWPQFALGLVGGGALGNLHDRLRWNHVVDFIHAYVIWDDKEYAWPTFNVADSFIVIGITILVGLGLFSNQLEEPPVPALEGSESQDREIRE